MNLDGTPEKYDHVLFVGNTYGPADAVSSDVDLTGVTGVMEIIELGTERVIARPTVTIDAATDTFWWGLTPTQTALIPPGRYRYHVTLTWSSTEIHTVLEGIITARRR